MNWPVCLGERATLDQLLQGASLARYGDGELKCALGRGYRSQAAGIGLGRELRRILRAPAPGCLPGIPTMDPAGPTIAFWELLRASFAPLLDPTRKYGSAFIGRANIAPWVDRADYVADLRRLWAGRAVVAVCPAGHGLPQVLAHDAVHVWHVVCPATDAYAEIDALESQCRDPWADLVVLAAGPTATCLADRLARRGLQAIDLGRGTGLVARHLATP